MPVPSPGDFPDPGIEPGSPELQADSLPLSHLESPCYLEASNYMLTFKHIHLHLKYLQIGGAWEAKISCQVEKEIISREEYFEVKTENKGVLETDFKVPWRKEAFNSDLKVGKILVLANRVYIVVYRYMYI